jgi:hypothetical protein
MNKIILCFAIALSACSVKTENEHGAHDTEKTPTSDSNQKSKSPRTSTMAMIGENHIHIDYSAPSMRGRQVFGGLVAYDEVWVTGAHKATNISFGKDVIIQGTPIKAGKYGVFTIPGEKKWTIIINNKWDMHLADDYQQTDDILRFDVDVETLPENVEELTFSVLNNEDNSVIISIAWSNVKVAFEVKNQ